MLPKGESGPDHSFPAQFLHQISLAHQFAKPLGERCFSISRRSWASGSDFHADAEGSKGAGCNGNTQGTFEEKSASSSYARYDYL